MRAFDSDLQSLNRLIVEMGGYVEKQLSDAIEALVKNDRELAQRIISVDAIVDELQHRIEENAIATIATRQPMAVDLRDVVGVLRLAGELERIGDLSKNIGKRVIMLSGDYMPRKALGGVEHIANLAQAQLRNVLASFTSRDIALARAVWMRDEEIDAMYTSLFRELLTSMMEDPGTMTFASTCCSAPRTSSGWAITLPTSQRRSATWSKASHSLRGGPKRTPPPVSRYKCPTSGLAVSH